MTPGAAAHRRRLLLHAGLHKTGTTAIQAALAGSADALRPLGLLFPQTGRAGPHGGHHNLAWQVTRDRRFRAAFGTIEQLAKEIAPFSGDVLLSSEDFETVLGEPAQLRALAGHEAFHGRPVTLLIHAREQSDYAESLYAEMLKHGMGWEARRCCDTILTDGDLRFGDWVFQFDYERVRSCVAQAGIATFILRPHGLMRHHSAVADILHVIGLDSTVVTDRRLNARAGLAHGLARFCRNRFGHDPKGAEARLKSLSGAGLGRAAARLSAHRKRDFAERFAPGNACTAEAHGFPAEALRQEDANPAAALDMEKLFSVETAEMLDAWLRGQVADAPMAGFLRDGCRLTD